MITKQPKYRAVYGYAKEEHIIIDKDELEKLHYAKHRGSFFTGKYGDVDTTKVFAIRPDYKATYGCMPEYELTGEDFDEIQKEHGHMANLIGESERKVKYLIDTKQTDLIGKNVDIPQLENKKDKEVSKEVKSIADKMKV